MNSAQHLRRRIGLGLVALGGLGAGAAWRLKGTSVSADSPSTLPAAFWQLEFPAPTGAPLGESIALSRFRGRPLLVNFWASWCPPCVRELPALDRWAREATAKQASVLGLAVDQADPVSRFLAKQPVSFPVALAGPAGLSWARTLGDDAGGLPFSLLIDRDGQILARKLGALEAEDLSDWHTRLLPA